MINKRIKVISIIILSSLALCACTNKEPVNSVASTDSSVVESVSRVSESVESTESVKETNEVSDPDLLLLEGLEYASIKGKYRLYNINFDKMYSDIIDFENDSIERFPAFVITEVKDDGSEVVVKKTIQEAYDKETFLSAADFLVDLYDMDKIYDNYLSLRKGYVERGYEEININDAIYQLTGQDYLYIESTLESALFQFMTLPGATTKGADFIMPTPYFPTMEVAVTDIGKDHYPEGLVKAYENAEIIVNKDNWIDADLLGGVRFLNPETGLIFDSHDEFQMRYYKLDKNEISLSESVVYDGYHEIPNSEEVLYVLKNADGTESYLTPEEAHTPKYEVSSIDDLNYNWVSYTPLNVVKLCEHLD
ncbi:MAG: hypothetical protein K6A97_04820 [Lachnospiraceae bacterium]|nr:hypothetical protein [Lachnospiraceae bacterium]